MTHPYPVFGGTDPKEIARAAEHGFATWIDTDAMDNKAVTAQGAMVVNAPLETAFDVATDFENTHKFLAIAQRSRIHSREGDRIELTLRQGFGMALFSVGLEERFRLKLNRPHSVICEEYVKGSFPTATYDMHFYEIAPGKTLFVMSFISDLSALAWLTRFFLKHQPEIEFAIAANLIIVPVSAMVAEAERRAGSSPEKAPAMSPPVWELIRKGELRPALQHGYLTVGRFDSSGNIEDVTCSTRLRGSPQSVWNAVTDPAVLSQCLSFVENGRILRSDEREHHTTLEYRVRIGPFTKRYHLSIKARCEAPHRLEAYDATIEENPFKQSQYLLEDGPNTLYSHMYFTDIKRDWLIRMFLKDKPDFERLISTYPSIIVSRAVRQHLGGPLP